jgi:hypothetical protein
MAFYWVFQNSTYKEESAGNYLWAPKKGKNGRTPFHWETMNDLQEGDIVFSSYQQKIVAVSTVLSMAYNHKKPFAVNIDNEWEEDGNKVDLNFHELNNPIQLKLFPLELQKLLNIYHGPLNSNGSGNQGYLFSLSDEAGTYLLSLLEKENTIDIETEFVKDIEEENISETTKKAIIESRVGQGQFRKNLIEIWDGKCAVTASALIDILIASHIKPWKVSNNKERLDPYNGLLLSPTYDKLFDTGYISFNVDGTIIISELLSDAQIEVLHVTKSDRLIKKPNHELNNYLKYHRKNILKKH